MFALGVDFGSWMSELAELAVVDFLMFVLWLQVAFETKKQGWCLVGMMEFLFGPQPLGPAVLGGVFGLWFGFVGLDAGLGI